MKYLVGLGSNLGESVATLVAARKDVSELPSTFVLCSSSLYRTAPVGGPEQADFINAVILVDSPAEPMDFLQRLQAIEHKHARVRTERWGPRTLDLDIIDVAGFKSQSDELHIPHPRACERAFVLVPAREVAPTWMLGDVELANLSIPADQPIESFNRAEW